jgi:hypothetical protein
MSGPRGHEIDAIGLEECAIRSGRRFAMAFRLRVTAIEYDSFGETVLTGVLESGQIGGGDPIRIPTKSGTTFQSVVASMEGPGPEPPPFRADKIGKAPIIVGIEGTPPNRDVIVPCVAEG